MPDVKTNKSRKLVLLMVALAIVVAGVSWVATRSYQTRNYAEEVASPINDALAKAGGVKKLGGGNNGRLSDNKIPYYDSVYEIAMDRNAALSLVNKIARDNGYSLKHASSTNKGPLDAVADIYIDNWYFDDTSKKSSFADLEDGPVELTVKFGDEDKPDSSGHTTVRISINLPAFK